MSAGNGLEAAWTHLLGLRNREEAGRRFDAAFAKSAQGQPDNLLFHSEFRRQIISSAAYSVVQARDYFASARTASDLVRPFLLFQGTLSLARVLVTLHHDPTVCFQPQENLGMHYRPGPRYQPGVEMLALTDFGIFAALREMASRAQESGRVNLPVLTLAASLREPHEPPLTEGPPIAHTPQGALLLPVWQNGKQESRRYSLLEVRFLGVYYLGQLARYAPHLWAELLELGEEAFPEISGYRRLLETAEGLLVEDVVRILG